MIKHLNVLLFISVAGADSIFGSVGFVSFFLLLAFLRVEK